MKSMIRNVISGASIPFLIRNYLRKWMVYGGIIATICCLGACSNERSSDRNSTDYKQQILQQLIDVINEVPGTVGVAVISDSDTILINNGVRFPMMSVFKLHQALAVCNRLEACDQSLDTILNIKSGELDTHTWSPELKRYIGKEFSISVADLIRYAVVSSDNNASNLLFRHIISPEATDGYIRSVANDTTFRIMYSEDDMSVDHSRAYANFTSPLSAALLIRKVFQTASDDKSAPSAEETLKISSDKLRAVREALLTVTTGHDRLGAPLHDKDGIVFGHKTGSGYRNRNDELAAFNDVGYIQLPSGKNYAIAVLIRDFHGSEAEAAEIIASISSIVFEKEAEG